MSPKHGLAVLADAPVVEDPYPRDQRHAPGDDRPAHPADIRRAGAIDLVTGKAGKSLAGASLGGERHRDPQHDEQRGDRLRQPGRLELAEHHVEGDADADRGKGGPQPACKRTLRRLDRAILGKIGTQLGPFRALFGVALAVGLVILRHTARVSASRRKARAQRRVWRIACRGCRAGAIEDPTSNRRHGFKRR